MREKECLCVTVLAFACACVCTRLQCCCSHILNQLRAFVVRSLFSPIYMLQPASQTARGPVGQSVPMNEIFSQIIIMAIKNLVMPILGWLRLPTKTYCQMMIYNWINFIGIMYRKTILCRIYYRLQLSMAAIVPHLLFACMMVIVSTRGRSHNENIQMFWNVVESCS